MIITTAKPWEEIVQSLAAVRRVFVVGCAACATKCQTGSTEAVALVVEQLTAGGKEISGSIVLDTPCDIRIVKKDFARLTEAQTADAVLVLACGAGVQAIADNVSSRVLPGLNPVFVGVTERIGTFHEWCSVCGECVLATTGGICPVTRCAKRLMNGPCGGEVNGKCESDPQRDCAWLLIYERLKKQGREKELATRYVPPRTVPKPRDVTRPRPGR